MKNKDKFHAKFEIFMSMKIQIFILKMEAARSSKMLVSYYMASQSR
jgi:hypothetical protein